MAYYRRYRNNRYYRSYRETSLLDDVIDMSLEVGIFLGGLILKGILKLSLFIFNRGKKAIGEFTVNKIQPDFYIKTDSLKENNINNTVKIDRKIVIDKNVSEGYQLKKSLLSESEQNFLDILKEIVGDKYIIQSQVPLYQIVSSDKSNHSYFNRIRAKTVDFVLCNKDFSPYLVIELDDRSHLRWDRIKRDDFVNNLMQSVKLRIIHIRASYSYDIDTIRKQIFG